MKTIFTYSVLFLVFLVTTQNSISQVPAAPSNLHATAVSSSQITLHWTDNSHNEEHFKIEVKTFGHHDTAFIPAGSVIHNITSFNMHHLHPNTTYLFRVAAVNHSGASHYSKIAGATTFHDTTQHSIPNAPSHLTAHASSFRTINLKWLDNSHNETGFVIEIKRSHDTAFSNAGYVGSNTTAFTATLLHHQTTYSFRVLAFNNAGSSHYSNIASATTHGYEPNELDYTLITNYPNPFNPSTIISYQLRVSNYVSLKVYDIAGNEVISLVNGKQDAGTHRVEFDGSRYSSGVYFYKLETENFSDTKRMMLIK